MDPATIARKNATLRDEFLRRGLTTADALDRIGFISHSELDLWESAGVMEDGLARLQEAWGLGLLRGELFNRKVLRSRTGEFSSKGLPSANLNKRVRSNLQPRVKTTEPKNRSGNEPIKILRGTRGPLARRTFHVHASTPVGGEHRSAGHIPEGMSARAYREEITPTQKLEAAGQKRLARMAAEERRKGNRAARNGDHVLAAKHHGMAAAHEKAATDREALRTHGAAELYGKRTKRLEKRIQRNVNKHAGERITPAAGMSRSQHQLSSAEINFNDAGRVSQRTLLAYAEEAASKPTTAEMYRDAQGNYHPSRAALHAHIIDQMLREPNPDGSHSPTNPYLQAPDGAPTVIWTGGGYAAGKGGVVKMLQQRGEYPEGALLIDPDMIKAMLPEFAATAPEDPEANLRVYSEAWDVAQALIAEAQKRKLNVVVDGISDSSADDVAGRVKSFTDAGYVNPTINYVTVPTATAIQRAKARAEKAMAEGDAASMRMIPEVIMRAVHRDVSATIPGVMARAKEMGVHVRVYDTDQGQDPTTSQFRKPKLIAEALPTGEVSHADQAAFETMLHKANEQISGVPETTDAPRTEPWKTAGHVTTIDPQIEQSVGRMVEAALPEAGTRKLPQPISDPEKLMTAAQVQTLPALRALLDMGAGIAAALGGVVEDISEGKKFTEVGQSVEDNMDKPHVIIAPVKGMKRALEKVAADGTPGDFSQLHDAVRATITVPTAQDLPKAIAALQDEVKKAGWTFDRVKPRLVDANGSARSTDNGYGDMSFIIRAPQSAGGLTSEVQINTNPLWWAKEIGQGHDWYAQERIVRDRVSTESRDATAEEAQLLKDLSAGAKPIYDRAWGLSLNGGAGHDVRTAVMGSPQDSAALEARLKDLSQQVAQAAEAV